MPNRFQVLSGSGIAVVVLSTIHFLFLDGPWWSRLIALSLICAGVYCYRFFERWRKENLVDKSLIDELSSAISEGRDIKSAYLRAQAKLGILSCEIPREDCIYDAEQRVSITLKDVIEHEKSERKHNNPGDLPALIKVTLTGILGTNLETRKISNGSEVAIIKLGIKNYEIDEATGEKREFTEWYRVVFFNVLVRFATDLVKLKKGDLVRVEGNLAGRNWRDKDGNDRFTVEVQATSFKRVSVEQSVDALS